MKAKLVLFGTFLILLSVFAGVSESTAQTSKKKKKTSTPIVTATPVPQTIPLVISRADDFPVQEQTIVTENPSEQTENTVDNTNNSNASIEELMSRIQVLESTQKNQYDEKQKRLLLNLDILTRAETRAESLRKQLFEMIEKGNTVQTRIEQLEYDLQPAMIERYAAFAGSLRPEQVREARQKSLESEKRNLESLMLQIQSNRKSLEDNVFKADFLVEKLRAKLEKDIDDALEEKEDKK
jgi:hypothetical protein